MFDLVANVPEIGSDVLVVRHTPLEAALRNLWTQLEVRRRHLIEAYQNVQLDPAAGLFRRASGVVACFGDIPDEARMIGVWRVNGFRIVDSTEYAKDPLQLELRSIAGGWKKPWPKQITVLDMVEVPVAEMAGNPVRIGWTGGEVNWKQWLKPGAFPILPSNG